MEQVTPTKEAIAIAATFKIRCSAIADIMTSTIGLTEAQLRSLIKLKAKHKAHQDDPTDKKCTPLTELQAQELSKLEQLKKDPPLPATLKTHCIKWVKEMVYGYRKEFTSKYTDKGNANEEWSLEFIAEQLGYGMLIKNEEQKSNSYMEGTCDTLVPDTVIDAKNSWDPYTFPLFASECPTVGYEYQIQGYMELWNRPKGIVCYVLSDTPDEIIEREAASWCRANGLEELDSKVLGEFKQRMTYSHLEARVRFKAFEYERDSTMLGAIQERVEICRAYIAQLLTTNNLDNLIQNTNDHE